MKFIFTLIFACFISFPSFPQNITGKQLLQKSIEYHDPKNKWATFKGGLALQESRPDVPDRETSLVIDNSKSSFILFRKKDGKTLSHSIFNEQCLHFINLSRNISEEDRAKYKLTCERTEMLRDYYMYLWGLPMKLKDPGTIIDKEAKEGYFLGKEALVLRVTYEEQVGDDIWYFYFQPKTYALFGYRFYHDESKKDGEYITLEGEKIIKGIRFPKTRKWYYNKDNKFLGADILK